LSEATMRMAVTALPPDQVNSPYREAEMLRFTIEGQLVIIKDGQQELRIEPKDWRAWLDAAKAGSMQHSELPTPSLVQTAQARLEVQVVRLPSDRVRMYLASDREVFVGDDRSGWQAFVQSAKRGELNVPDPA
jgi:hypothetical protein